MTKRGGIPELEGKHYDVGIFGMWFGENYGSTLTYFALRKALIDRGCSVLMLEKPNFGGGDAEHDPSIHPRVFAAEEGYDISPVLKPSEFKLFNDYCDAFVVGSDQVWNYKIARYFRNLSYLTFARPGKKRFSYASSFGHASSLTPKSAISDVAKFFNNLDAISVRESDGVDIARNEFGVTATQVVDPIYLHDRSVYDEVMREPADTSLPEHYLLCYVLDANKEVAAVIASASERMGLEPIVMLDGRGDLEQAKENLGGLTAFRCPDARQWLYYISHADFMITDSFHGASFALLFHTQVSIVGNARGVSRVKSLVETFHIPFILARDVEELGKLLEEPAFIDFDQFDRILAMERARSGKWLDDTLALEPEVLPTIECVTKKECCGCAACYSICPVDAISMLPDSEGFLYPQIDQATCISCGKCKKACPSLHPRLEKKGKPMCFAAYGDDSVRKISSSGGLFSMVAAKVFEQGGKVCGAAFDEDFTLGHTWAANADELGPLRMSKYMQSFTGESYKEAKSFLDQGIPVLYVGCPCQVAGLNSFLGKDYENLFTMDLLCHGGPSQSVFKNYLDEVHHGREISYVGFRDKDYFGWSTEMTVKYADGEIYRKVRNEDLFYRAFLPCFSVRPHCQVCNFSRLPRQGDLTLGDFWGVSRLDKRFSDGGGTSIVSVNSDRGLKMLDALWDDLVLLETVTRDYILTHGQPYNNPFRNDPRRSRFHRMLADTSLETAVVNAESGIFDFAVIGAHGDRPGDVLGAYALEKTLARADHSVLVVGRPVSFDPAPNPGKYRFREFMNAHVPVLSAHKTLAAQGELKYYCRGFATLGAAQRYEMLEIAGDKAVTSWSYISSGLVTPLILLDEADIRVLLPDGYATDEMGGGCICINDEELRSRVLGGPLASYAPDCDVMAADEGVIEWVGKLKASRLVITDDVDAAYVAALFDVPVALFAKRGGESEPTIGAASHALGVTRVADADELTQIFEDPSAFRPRSSSLDDMRSEYRELFVEAAEAAMGPVAERPPKEEPVVEDKVRKSHGKAYKAVARVVPKRAKRIIKAVVREARRDD